MKLKELKKLATTLLVSGALAFTVSACEGDRDVSAEPSQPGQSGTEQPVEAPSTEAPSNEFDVNTVALRPIASSDITFSDHLEQNGERLEVAIDSLNNIVTRYNNEVQELLGPGIVDSTMFFASDLLSVAEQAGSEVLFSEFQGSHMMSYAMFSVNEGDRGLAIVQDILIKPEAQQTFDQAVIQVIRDAEEHGTTNIYRLLDEVLEMDEPNNFVNLCAAMLTGYLMARSPEAHLPKVEEVHNHIEKLYARGF